ncbi:MAG: elongation factor P, partial [Henriciella sp.]
AIPDQVTVTVEETEPVVKGQTAANSFKPAICDGGVRVTVPPFIGVGERIIVQTSDRTYLRRAD